MIGATAFALAAAGAILLAGRALHRAIPALTRWDIPEAVSGGLLWAAGALALHAAGLSLPAIPAALREPVLLAFFAALGLQADLASLGAGGRRLLRFGALTCGFILVQNALGVAAALALGLDPLIGLLAGSVTLVGGHGTGAAYGALFAERYGLAAALEIALAFATVGLVLGGLLAGPIARGLLPGAGPAEAPSSAAPAATERDLLAALGLLLLATAAAAAISPLARAMPFTVPDFLWALLAGALLRNLVLAPLGRAPAAPTLELLAGLLLALFLALAMATLRLWEIAALALPLLALLALQTLLTIAWVRLVCFRALGGGAEAAVLSAGFLGFALGSTATALAAMRELERKTGPLPEARLVVSLTAGLVATLANALILAAFLALPLFAP